MAETSVMEIADSTANPAPLGLLAFGMTTVLLNLANAGIIELSSMIVAMGIFYGGLAQVIAGIMEWKKKNTFGTTAFLSYGMFWLSLVALIYLPMMFPGVKAPTGSGEAAYLGLWGIFTLGLFVGTLRINRALQVVFATLVVLFFLLAAAKGSGSAAIGTIAGYEGILCGASAMYTGFALLLNEVFGTTVLPIGSVAPVVPFAA